MALQTTQSREWALCSMNAIRRLWVGGGTFSWAPTWSTTRLACGFSHESSVRFCRGLLSLPWACSMRTRCTASTVLIWTSSKSFAPRAYCIVWWLGTVLRARLLRVTLWSRVDFWRSSSQSSDLASSRSFCQPMAMAYCCHGQCTLRQQTPSQPSRQLAVVRQVRRSCETRRRTMAMSTKRRPRRRIRTQGASVSAKGFV
mmetsp:Transcript_11824/g.33416  ORF Transcript_11824/g.33416 Transcript_11824/m.33416 type:complete len:200 (+) Transcript_11824:430-1029(+)